MAVLRGVHQLADAPLVFSDPLAIPILGLRGEAAVAAHLPERQSSARLRASVVGRARMAEDTMRAAHARGVRQYVLLGAGLDSFGLRAELHDVTVFEVDHPATQGLKRRMLHQAGLQIPPTMHFVPMDFERQDLRATLEQAGFRFDQPAVFAMLGVAIYVERAALLATWAMIASMAPGAAELVFDYAEDFTAAAPPVHARYEAVARRAADVGEPWRTYFDPPALDATLRGLCFREVRDFNSDELRAHLFCGRTDDLAPGPLSHVVIART